MPGPEVMSPPSGSFILRPPGVVRRQNARRLAAAAGGSVLPLSPGRADAFELPQRLASFAAKRLLSERYADRVEIFRSDRRIPSNVVLAECP
jgi:hypothetical protein